MHYTVQVREETSNGSVMYRECSVDIRHVTSRLLQVRVKYKHIYINTNKIKLKRCKRNVSWLLEHRAKIQ